MYASAIEYLFIVFFRIKIKDAQDILVVLKFHNLLSRERYHKHMLDENGQLLYPTNRNISSSSNQPRSTIFHYELDLFYVDTPWGIRRGRLSNCIFGFSMELM
jgi:hypothetical protein